MVARVTTLERKRHSRLSLIVEACCTSNDANQWPGDIGKMKTEMGFCFQEMGETGSCFRDAPLPEN
jgi:hypothetical protein